MKCWYLVYTKPRQERVAEQNFRRQSYEVYLPLIQQPCRHRGRWIEAIGPLFPCYLFLRCQPGYDDISPIRYTTGVRNIVSFNGEPAVVPDHIIESIKQTADYESGVHHFKGSLFEPGNKVIIDRGPLTGLQGIFLAETGQERVVILLEILGRENRITVKRDLLRLA